MVFLAQVTVVASDREQFLAIVQRGDIVTARLPQALTAAGIAPGLARWRAFIDSLLLWLGASAIAAGLLFFVAFNWEAMGRFARFGLVQVLMVATIGGYVWFQSHERLRKVLLFVACVLVGILLALYGQTYQTGADPWELFAVWAVFIVPWTLISRFAPLWLLLVGLVNVALILYCDTFRPQVPWLAYPELTLAFCLALFNSLVLVLWEWRMGRHAWMRDNWSPRLLTVGAGLPATLLAIQAVLEADSAVDLIVLIAWAAAFALLIWFYRFRRPDLFMLAASCFAIISVLIAWLTEHVIDDFSGSGGAFLLMAVAIVAMGATAALWLKKMQRAMYEELR